LFEKYRIASAMGSGLQFHDETVDEEDLADPELLKHV
jgi:hypothetical protein